MLLRFIFVLLIVPFFRTWPKLFVWLEEQYSRRVGRGASELEKSGRGQAVD